MSTEDRRVQVNLDLPSGTRARFPRQRDISFRHSKRWWLKLEGRMGRTLCAEGIKKHYLFTENIKNNTAINKSRAGKEDVEELTE